MNTNGYIYGGGQNIGTYQANNPFRIRMYVDMDTKTWSAVIDNEMDGFDDDVVVTGLDFSNDPNRVLSIHGLGASLSASQLLGGTRIAYDDIIVKRILQ